MEWYQYIAAFFSGVFLANAVPHFIHGVSGNKFPTPFAKPPGKGLSSANVNTWWGSLNIVIGYLLFKASHLQNSLCCIGPAVFFAGALAISLMLSKHFVHKDKE